MAQCCDTDNLTVALFCPFFPEFELAQVHRVIDLRFEIIKCVYYWRSSSVHSGTNSGMIKIEKKECFT